MGVDTDSPCPCGSPYPSGVCPRDHSRAAMARPLPLYREAMASTAMSHPEGCTCEVCAEVESWR